MYERAKSFVLAAAVGSAALFTTNVSPVEAGGCYKDSEVPYCNPLTLTVDRPRFVIRALDYTHSGIADVWVGSKTKEFGFFGKTTAEGSQEAQLLIEKYCGPSGDNSLVSEEGPTVRTLVASLERLSQIP